MSLRSFLTQKSSGWFATQEAEAGSLVSKVSSSGGQSVSCQVVPIALQKREKDVRNGNDRSNDLRVNARLETTYFQAYIVEVLLRAVSCQVGEPIEFQDR